MWMGSSMGTKSEWQNRPGGQKYIHPYNTPTNLPCNKAITPPTLNINPPTLQGRDQSQTVMGNSLPLKLWIKMSPCLGPRTNYISITSKHKEKSIISDLLPKTEKYLQWIYKKCQAWLWLLQQTVWSQECSQEIKTINASGICTFSLCLCGLSPDALVTSHIPKMYW